MVFYQLNIFTMNMAQRIENIIKHSDEGKYEGIVIILKNWNTNQWFKKIRIESCKHKMNFNDESKKIYLENKFHGVIIIITLD